MFGHRAQNQNIVGMLLAGVYLIPDLKNVEIIKQEKKNVSKKRRILDQAPSRPSFPQSPRPFV
jgi:hypothetical protein